MRHMEKDDGSECVVIEDWAENVMKNATVFNSGKLYGHLDRSHIAVMVDMDEIDFG